MSKYIHTEYVETTPVTLGEYNLQRGWSIPNNEDPDELGQMLMRSDGSVTYIPDDKFKKQFMPLVAEQKMITQKDVWDFIVKHETHQLDSKTTVVVATLKNGYTITESDSCVDSKRFNIGVSTNICMRKIEDKVWELLGFLLQSAVTGFGK